MRERVTANTHKLTEQWYALREDDGGPTDHTPPAFTYRPHSTGSFPAPFSSFRFYSGTISSRNRCLGLFKGRCHEPGNLEYEKMKTYQLHPTYNPV